MATNIKLPPLKLFINGKWLDSSSGKTFSVVDPSSEKEIARLPEATLEDVNSAVSAARAALTGKWAALGAGGRRNILFKFADLVERDAVSLATLECHNNGSPFEYQKFLVGLLADYIRYYAGWADKLDGRLPVVDGNYHIVVQREPVGVCGLILPWNLPLWALFVKMGPCLASGNTCIIKPAEQTPLTTLAVAALIEEAGFPEGVVNVVTGFGQTGSALSHHMDIDKVAFTGSTDVGRLIMKAAAESNIKKVQLELGGKAPLVICEDADLDQAAEVACSAIFTNNGQLCTAGARTYVHKAIKKQFIEKVIARATAIKVGHPFTSQLGPLVDKDQFDRVRQYIEAGKREGAKIEFGGNRVGDSGYFVQPTVFSNVTDNMSIAKEEIFGPVMCVIEWETFPEVIQKCNSSSYGLAAGIVSKDVSNILTLAKHIKAGSVWANTYHAVFPQVEFGGVKQSGFGREGGPEGVHEWTHTKAIAIGYTSRM